MEQIKIPDKISLCRGDKASGRYDKIRFIKAGINHLALLPRRAFSLNFSMASIARMTFSSSQPDSLKPRPNLDRIESSRIFYTLITQHYAAFIDDLNRDSLSIGKYHPCLCCFSFPVCYVRIFFPPPAVSAVADKYRTLFQSQYDSCLRLTLYRSVFFF